MKNKNTFLEENLKILAPNYYIVFKENNTNNSYMPVIIESLVNIKNSHSSTKLFFDEDLNITLDIIEKLLHFPRINYDASLLTPNQVSKINNSSQSIIHIPEELFNMAFINSHKKNDKDYFILSEGVTNKDNYKEILSNVYTFEDFQKFKIKEIWAEICDYDNGMNKSIQYLTETQLALLPLIHFSDFLGNIDEKIFQLNAKSIKEIADYRWKQQGYLDACKIFVELNRDISEEEKQKIKDQALAKAKFPVTVTAPGQPIKVNKATSDEGVPSNELRALNLIGIHNAIENNGIHVPIEEIDKMCFVELEKLETHCKLDSKPNSRYIWRILRKLGSLITKQFNENEIDIIRRSSHINIFSNFPIGLAIFPGATAPLCCYKSISYKPISPLTRTLQVQLPKKMNILVSQGSKILIIECIDSEDKIRKASDAIWKHFMESINPLHFNVVYEIAKNSKEFNTIINKHSDTLFLIISAHGFEDTQLNFSGIKIGKSDCWSPIGNDFHSPPIVLFSACYTGSRGKGIVSIADLFIRCGALTVLNTLVPVDVFKNGLLMIRFFIYISESMEGKNSFGNLSEVWEYVVSSNAVNEVIESTKGLKQWAFTLRENGTWPLKDFQLIEAPKKLYAQDVYKETVNILRDIALKDGVLNKFDNALRMDNSLPESLFYQLIGYPEHILINPIVLELQ